MSETVLWKEYSEVNMPTLTFEWFDKEKQVNKRMDNMFICEMDAWLSALSACGWENRLTLRTVNSKGYTLTNWFEISHKLPILCHPANVKSDREFYRKKYW